MFFRNIKQQFLVKSSVETSRNLVEIYLWVASAAMLLILT